MPYFDETTQPHQDVTRLFESRANPFQECLILASRGDSLGALIKSSALDNTQRAIISDFCALPTQQADTLISDALASEPEWVVRRKARNVKRRLLIALLCKYEGYSPDALKGARYKVLLNLAMAKGLIAR